MAATRWHSNVIDLFDWISENDTSLLDIFMPPLVSQLDQKTDEEPMQEDQLD